MIGVMCQLDKLRQQREAIYQIARKHNANKVYVFGSCARRQETPASDVDLLVDFGDASLFDHILLENEVSAFLNMPVDVVSLRALRDDSFGQQVRREMIPL